MTVRLPGWAPEWIALAAAAGALLIAHLVQNAGFVPCALCYLERWPYRAAILVALIGLLTPRARPLIGLLLLLSFAGAAALAWVHVGVEAGWWKSPLPECAAPPLRTGSVRDLLASLPAHPSKPCDDPTYLIPGLPLSMAQMNLAAALVSAALVAMSLKWTHRRQ